MTNDKKQSGIRKLEYRLAYNYLKKNVSTLGFEPRTPTMSR